MKKYRHIHFIGIKGVAMTALAVLAKQMGSKITGSDVAEEFVTDEILKRNKINYTVGFSEKNIVGNPDLVIVTGAHGGLTNPEAVSASLKGLKVVTQGQALGMFMEGYTQISVAGTHGKTTTSAILAYLFEKAGLSPGFAVGCADIPALKTSAKFGKGKYFIAEADEYVTDPKTDKTPRFLWQNPKNLIITNIEYDHPDVYQNIEEIKVAFAKLIQKLPSDGLLVTCIDNNNIKELIKHAPRVITYGKGALADWKILRIYNNAGKTNFWLEYKGREMGHFQISLPGEHNVLNAIAAIIVALEEGIDLEKIRKYLPLFTGTKRRFEKIAEINKIILYDDYAHHPTEIRATLKALKNWYPEKRIIAIFQPHTYSRTKALFKEFGLCFSDADIILVSDIYSSAREIEKYGITSAVLVEELCKHHPQCYYTKGENEVLHYLEHNIRENDIIITLGAGDIYKIHNRITKIIQNSNFQ